MAFDPAVLRAGLAVVERRADQLTAYFYAHLFAHNPGVRAMFPERMEEQRDRLLAAITHLVQRLDDPERLAGYLAALGRDHRKFGARPEHYPAVGASLLATLQRFAGNAWSEEQEKAWTEAWTVISRAMVDAAAAVPAGTPACWQAEVVRRHPAAPDVTVLTLAPDRPYPFTPGQYLTLCSPRVPQVWRPFSIGCAPRPDGTLDVHVRRVPDGLLSPVLVDAVRPGERLRLGPPLGTAVLDPASRRPLLAVAGGTGWAQVKAVVEELARAGTRPATVLLGARSDADHYDLDAVRALVERYARLEVVLAAPADGAGRAEAVALLHAGLGRLGDCAGRDVLLSGPPDLAPAVAARLAALGADPSLVRHDPVPRTLDRSRPATAAERFLQPRDVAWINRTELA
ncbi:globin domain-containing protein [Kitasatospora sp. NPDC007106]|uniref:globin domain-containing protein n=1 Tax=Kitasatospora sp. NPDC007106 TaxID=3156914 RepID=UPI0033F73955